MNNNRKDKWSGNWAKEKLLADDDNEVSSIKLINQNLLKITDKHNRKYKVATMSLSNISKSDLEELFKGKDVSFVLNIYKDPYISEDALEYSLKNEFSIGNMGDLIRALEDDILENYIPPTASFVLRGLQQHNKVLSAKRLDSHRIKINRCHFPSVIILVLSEYELTADSFRYAMERVPDFDAVLASNPNRGPTNECVEAVLSTGKRIFTWAELFQILNKPWN